MSQITIDSRNQHTHATKVFKIYYNQTFNIDIPQSIIYNALEYENTVNDIIARLGKAMIETLKFPENFKLDRQLAQKYFLLRGIDYSANGPNTFENFFKPCHF